VKIRKEVHTETVNVPVSLKREAIVVERVPADAFTEGEVRIPTMREEAVVEKTAKVVGEVRVSKKTETDEEVITETIRKEEVKVDKDGAPGRRRLKD
jgi:uncharacterized protein (TIGR02271 family)